MMEQPIAETASPTWKELNIETDSSLNRSLESHPLELTTPKFMKKRIGPYSYKLSDVIGCGFSSIVYKGCKDNDKEQVVAIKVVKLQGLKPHRRQLLEKEIQILKMVHHPHIIVFHDIYYTVNNCYIITEYCEGGNLQHLIEREPHLDWRKAAYQISIACQYLASLNIIHRDIKPANVLINHGTFKLSDFGFSIISQNSQPIKEGYLIGSPLYMPIESLQIHEYSSKSDSFALGVLLYYLTANRFPWKGKSKEQLATNYRSKKYSKKGISHLPPRIKHLIHNLLEQKSNKRPHLKDCDFEAFLHLGPPRKVDQQLIQLKGCYEQQLNLCQFINSLRENALYFERANNFLLQFMNRHLSSLTKVFEWQSQPGLNQIKNSLFYLSNEDPNFTSDDYYWLNNCLKDTIRVLTQSEEITSHVALQKLLKYQQIIQAILFQTHQEILLRINLLTLDPNFALSTPDHNYIVRTLPTIDFYQL